MVQGLDRLDSEHGHPMFFILTGVLIAAIGLIHNKIVKDAPKSTAVCFWVEALMLLFIAFSYFEAGKKYTPFIYIALVVIYIFIGYIILKPKARKGKNNESYINY